MNSKRKDRCWLLVFLALDLILMGWLGYRLLDRKIPDQILVDHEDSREVANLLKRPFISFDDAITVSGKDSYKLHCRLLGVIPFKDVKVKNITAKEVYASGDAVGIYMQTKGVLIIDTGEILSESGEMEEPARDIVKPGDYIVAFDQNRIQCKQDLLEDLADLCGESVTLKVRRGKETIPLSLTPVKDEKGNPGELSGLIRYEADNILGEISENSKNGIFGTVDADQVKNLDLKKIPVGYKQDLKIGPASVLCCTDGEVKEYAAEITRIDMNHEDSNKSFVIQITDKELLEKTGGIVQGMSGSPVLQNGKLFGAVTHVFVQDSTGGYGIFIENMTGNA